MGGSTNHIILIINICKCPFKHIYIYIYIYICVRSQKTFNMAMVSFMYPNPVRYIETIKIIK
jgi:hypothetical protein